MASHPPKATGEAPHRRAILVIAHPGHELRVHRWLETARPEVCVLTDGSGRTAHSRIRSTSRTLEATGAKPGPVYGRMRDVDLYNALIHFDHDCFTELADQLATALVRNDVDCIVGDAAEGYNPAHDICRLIINAAVRSVEHNTRRQIANLDFTLASAPGHCPDELRARSIWVHLDEAAFARKLAAARNYPELQTEVDSALNGNNDAFSHHYHLTERARLTFGVTAPDDFRVECLRPVDASVHSSISVDGEPPYYEVYGAKQVKAGYYSNVIRYEEHLLPLAVALDSHVPKNSWVAGKSIG